MKKKLIAPNLRGEKADPQWLPLEAIAEVEITSESAGHPIEAALTASGAGWRAESSGPQTIRLKFVPPRPVRQVRVAIEEREKERTQEFVLRAAVAPGAPRREIARQQFNFSPAGATWQQEDYQLELAEVAEIELTIVPDISGRDTKASIQQLRIAG
jgi:hypothetical protein